MPPRPIPLSLALPREASGRRAGGIRARTARAASRIWSATSRRWRRRSRRWAPAAGCSTPRAPTRRPSVCSPWPRPAAWRCCRPIDSRRRCGACAPSWWAALIDPARDASALAGLPRLDPLAQPPAPAPVWRLDRDAPFAEFETSGTTGEGRWIPKALRHLEDEIETLEAVFGARLPRGARVFATVSHQHIYGLLFRVLWPLGAGRPFHANLLLHCPGAVSAHARVP